MGAVVFCLVFSFAFIKKILKKIPERKKARRHIHSNIMKENKE